ncbi:MAG: hypothetical protein K2N25_06480, partial [Muribaculaceae bacterium]|nr:hypothetical protein [Muribaculaceae bacterium]
MGEAKPPTHGLRSIVVNNQLSAGWEACCSIGDGAGRAVRHHAPARKVRPDGRCPYTCGRTRLSVPSVGLPWTMGSKRTRFFFK